jgi:membrane-associated phospholipid phosphatase
MWKNIINIFEGFPWWMIPIIVVIVVVVLFFPMPPKVNPVLKDFKDGIQNHLTWSIKGECFFVRPNDDVTVYLVRVPDCDKK